MSRSAGLLAALLAAPTAPLLGCGRTDTDARSRQETRIMDSLTLSAAQPRLTLSLPDSLTPDKDVLLLTITDVRNPDHRPVSLDVALEAPGDTAPLSVGAVALFPVDQGGTFALRLPAAARELLLGPRSRASQARVIVTLSPDPRDQAADRRALTVAGLRWSATGR